MIDELEQHFGELGDIFQLFKRASRPIVPAPAVTWNFARPAVAELVLKFNVHRVLLSLVSDVVN